MNKEFIPYEEALELKELGFNEECLDKYIPTSQKLSSDMETWGEFYPESAMIPAPLYQQAFRWFREKYNYCYFIRGNNYDGYYYYDIDNLGMLKYKIEIDNRLTWETYEEAELECLKKLIEIIKP